MDVITMGPEAAIKKVNKKPIAKKQVVASSMESQKVQTVLRLRPELMARLKYKAAQCDMSVNAYVESVLKDALQPRIPQLPKGFKIDPLIKSLSGIIPAVTPPTQEELDQDPKFARLWEKYLKP